MRIEEEVKLDFCDVLIRPKRSEAASRKDVELVRYFYPKYHRARMGGIPIIAANMDTTGTLRMAASLEVLETYTALHKFHSIESLEDHFNSHSSDYSFFTLGMREGELDKLHELHRRVGFAPYICVDVANGYTKQFVRFVSDLRGFYPEAVIMAGNVATPEMVQELILEGADIVKVGIGPGSHCTTRLVTGVGYPQLSAIIECADAAHGLGGLIAADGGCKTPADVVKAFAAGADFVMLGGMLAGTDECDGVWTEEGLLVHGMSSREAQEKYYGGVREYVAPEGRESTIAGKGPVEGVMQDILGGLRSACAYVGAKSLKDLSKCTTFVRVSRTQ